MGVKDVPRFMSYLGNVLRRIGGAACIVAAVAQAPAMAVNLGPDEPVRLNASVTVSGTGVRLGDLFTGLPMDEAAVVAPAPAPGQRTVLAADWLANVARTYHVDWRPSDAYDRAVVYRPGRVLAPAQILDAFKEDLVTKGMPADMGLRPGSPLPTLVVPEEAPNLTVREAYYDAITKSFSAVGEFTGGDGKPQFIRVRGTTYPTITVPVLKDDVSRLKVITADMIDYAEVADTSLHRDTILDAEGLIGKSPKTVIRAGQAIRAIEVMRMNLVDIPVLRANLQREDVIGENSIMWTTVNAAALPADVVTTADYLIGKSPRRLIAANAPIRRSEVISSHPVTMAVASRDLPRGAPLDKTSISWVTTTDDAVGPAAITDESAVTGRVTRHPVRAGQPLRAIDIIKPVIIPKNKLVTILYTSRFMTLTVRGKAMEDGAAQDTIRVANANSKSVVLAEVVDENTVRVNAQQSAMR
jgi:flagella basal body P-ring formation protein FlgA